MILIWVLVAVVVVMLGYIRLAPSDPVVWNVMPQSVEADKDFKNGVIRVVEIGSDGLTRFDEIAMKTARTKRIPETGQGSMVTYVTRSAVLGFPDYTTVRQDGEKLTIYARARFGRSDFGVNRDRVQTWIDALKSG